MLIAEKSLHKDLSDWVVITNMVYKVLMQSREENENIKNTAHWKVNVVSSVYGQTKNFSGNTEQCGRYSAMNL